METDVLIIGAGPAGLAAAYETASKGIDVTIVYDS
jgi:sarcosine oxidase subunit alpha